MSKFLQLALSFVLCLGTFSLSAQTIYVDASATGANDGSSWADAYTDLQSALTNAADGQSVWIAAGDYKPGASGDNEETTFLVSNTLSIYGGFAGTESSVEDRDLTANVTTLNGDLNGDDTAGDYETNKTDNVLHVMQVDSNLVLPLVIDGVRVINGYTGDFNADIPDYFYRGAGVFAYSAINMNNCTFVDNRAGSGAGVFLRGINTSGSTVENSRFEHNLATAQAALYMEVANNVSVTNCDFIDNDVNRGALYPNTCLNVTVDNCRFEDNVNTAGFGAGFFAWQPFGLTLSNCEFTNNRSANAGAMYIDGRNEPDADTDRVTITNCSFTGNNTTADNGFGGAIYMFRISYTMEDCTFTNNTATGSAGALGNFGTDKSFIVRNTVFEGNSANFGGAHASYSANTMGLYENCIFEENMAGTSGAGGINGFQANITFDGCTFEENSARWGGGMYTQNDTTVLTVMNCDFFSNEVENLGGGLNISGGVSSTIVGCNFEGNQAGTGGGIHLADDVNDQAVSVIDACRFILNAGTENQAGGLNVSSVDLDITNTVFGLNAAAGNGIGGAISLNDTDTTLVNITNCTLSENTGVLAGGITAWTSGDTLGDLLVTLRNTALVGNTTNYSLEDGIPQIQSGGGNFSDDDSLEGLLSEMSDQNSASDDPLFVDAGDFDFSLQEGSPLIDAGVADGATEFDLDGNQRDENPDIGAYEFVIVDNINELAEANRQLSVFPNPMEGEVQLTIGNEWRGAMQLYVLDAEGRRVRNLAVNKQVNTQSFTLDMTGLPAGTYLMVAEQANQRISQRAIKL